MLLQKGHLIHICLTLNKWLVFLAEIEPCSLGKLRSSNVKPNKISDFEENTSILSKNENSLDPIGVDYDFDNSNFLNGNQIKTYPNPSNGSFNVVALNAISENVLIEVFDMLGIRCYSKEQAGFKQAQISLENVNKGVFFVKITSANKSLSTKLIIQ